jgi:hypothetical protein
MTITITITITTTTTTTIYHHHMAIAITIAISPYDHHPIGMAFAHAVHHKYITKTITSQEKIYYTLQFLQWHVIVQRVAHGAEHNASMLLQRHQRHVQCHCSHKLLQWHWA